MHVRGYIIISEAVAAVEALAAEADVAAVALELLVSFYQNYWHFVICL